MQATEKNRPFKLTPIPFALSCLLQMYKKRQRKEKTTIAFDISFFFLIYIASYKIVEISSKHALITDYDPDKFKLILTLTEPY